VLPSAAPQAKGSCYAYAAAGAYINTCRRIYGASVPIPDFKAAVDKLLLHNGDRATSVVNAVRFLERQYGCGVRCHETDETPRYYDLCTNSVVVTFRTSRLGWDAVEAGSLLNRPPGEAEGDWHAFLVDSYLIERGFHIAINSWGRESGNKGRVNFRFEAFHQFSITKVFFTRKSIIGKTIGPYLAVINRFPGVLDGVEIECAYVNLMVVLYDSRWVYDVRSTAEDKECRRLLLKEEERRKNGLPLDERVYSDPEPRFLVYDLMDYTLIKERVAEESRSRPQPEPEVEVEGGGEAVEVREKNEEGKAVDEGQGKEEGNEGGESRLASVSLGSPIEALSNRTLRHQDQREPQGIHGPCPHSHLSRKLGGATPLFQLCRTSVTLRRFGVILQSNTSSEKQGNLGASKLAPLSQRSHGFNLVPRQTALPDARNPTIPPVVGTLISIPPLHL
jgi:hypothetical protein